MNFLAPLFLLGALAVGLPVVFHLIRRSSREQMTFSSLMFLQPAPPRVTKRSRLEHILLLLLRCLVICLLALGFSRPFFQKPILASQTPEAGRKVIVLVDASASMRREGLWPAALAKAGEVLRNTSPADEVSVCTFDDRTHSVVSFEQWSAMNPGERATLTAGRLAGLKPGWAATHLGSALTTAAESFPDAGKQGQSFAPRHIVLITDLQEGSRLDGLQGYEWPRGIDVQVETIQPSRPTNAGLQWIADNNDSSHKAADAGPRIRVSNSGNAKREQFQLRWDGVAGALPLDVYVPPGQSRIVSAPKLPANTPGEKLVLTGDDDDFDNTVYLVQPKAEQINVLYLGDEAAPDSTQPLYFLKRAFQPTPGQIVQIKSFRAAETPLAPDLSGARLLIASDTLPETQATITQSFLAGGGTVLFVMKSAAGAGTLGRLTRVEGLAAEEAVVTNYAMFGLVDFQHPLFAPFNDTRYNDFTKIHFWKYRRLNSARLPGARVLARFDNGDAALIEIPEGKGRLLVLTSGWQPADSQLALSSKFVPLLYSILDLAGGFQTHLTQYFVNEQVNLAQAASSGAPAITVRKPDGSQVQMAAGETKFSQTDQPGIYAVTSVQPELRFAVNLDAAESRTAPLPLDQLERLGIPMKAREIEMSKQLARQRRLRDTELENQQKLWRWLTLAALMLLLGETWLAGRLTRRTAFKPEVAT